MGHLHASSSSPRDSRKQRGGMWARAVHSHRPSARAREVQLRTLNPKLRLSAPRLNSARYGKRPIDFSGLSVFSALGLWPPLFWLCFCSVEGSFDAKGRTYAESQEKAKLTKAPWIGGGGHPAIAETGDISKNLIISIDKGEYSDLRVLHSAGPALRLSVSGWGNGRHEKA